MASQLTLFWDSMENTEKLLSCTCATNEGIVFLEVWSIFSFPVKHRLGIKRIFPCSFENKRMCLPVCMVVCEHQASLVTWLQRRDRSQCRHYDKWRHWKQKWWHNKLTGTPSVGDQHAYNLCAWRKWQQATTRYYHHQHWRYMIYKLPRNEKRAWNFYSLVTELNKQSRWWYFLLWSVKKPERFSPRLCGPQQMIVPR